MDPVLLVPKRRWPRPALWLDASDASTYTLADTDRVTSWRNKYDATHDFTAAADARPTLVTGASGINGLPAIEFDGTDDRLLHGGTPLTSGSTEGSTVIVVCRSNANTDVSTLYAQQDKDTDNRYIRLQRLNDANSYDPRFLIANTTAGQRVGDYTLTASTAHVLTFAIDKSNVCHIYRNATKLTMGSASVVSPWGAVTGADSAAVGSYAQDAGAGVVYGDFWDGAIASVMGWNELLSTSQLSAVQHFLIAKYGA